MDTFVVIYLILLLGGFAAFLILFRRKNEEKRYRNAAEKLISEDMLFYSLKNPYTIDSDVYVPPAKRLFVGVKMLSEGRKRYVYDPSKYIYIGHSDTNQIIIYDNEVSQRHACIYLAGGKPAIYVCSTRRGLVVTRGAANIGVAPGQELILQSGDTVKIGVCRFRITLFTYDINQK